MLDNKSLRVCYYKPRVFIISDISNEPDDAERNGDFGEVCPAQGGTFDETGMCTVAQGQIWDPFSGTYQDVKGYGSGAVRSAFRRSVGIAGGDT